MSDSDAAAMGAPANTIDIIMPFYGDPGLFRLAVESVLAQTDPHWRLVVVDDVYPDPAPGAWAGAHPDSRVTYVRNDRNLGVNGNFVKCTTLATATFTTIIGCDDLLLPNYVARIRQLLERFPDVDYIQPGVEVMDARGADASPLADRVKGYYRPTIDGPLLMSGEELASSLLRGNWTYFPSIAWRTSRLKEHGFRRDLEVVLDLALQLDIVASHGTVVLDDVPSFRYRRHASSVSSWTADDGSRFVEEQRFFRGCARRMRELGWTSAARIARRHVSSRLNALTRMPASLKAHDRRGAVILVRHALGLPNRVVRASAPAELTRDAP